MDDTQDSAVAAAVLAELSKQNNKHAEHQQQDRWHHDAKSRSYCVQYYRLIVDVYTFMMIGHELWFIVRNIISKWCICIAQFLFRSCRHHYISARCLQHDIRTTEAGGLWSNTTGMVEISHAEHAAVSRPLPLCYVYLCYLLTDVLLLTDVFEHFQQTIMLEHKSGVSGDAPWSA